MSKQRLINANEAEEIIWARSEEIRDSEPELSGALAGAIGFLDRCKTVDAVPVVHGEWINSALRFLTIARESWMLHHSEDFDADFYASLFDDARICLERINDNCKTDICRESEVSE